MVTNRLTSRLGVSGYSRMQGFGGYGISEIVGDAEMRFAVAFLHPRCHQPNGNAARMRFGLGEVGKQCQPFEIAPCGENDLYLARVSRIKHVLRTCPKAADIFGIIDHRIWRIIWGSRDIKSRVEHPRLAMGRTPAREGNEHIKIEPQARFGEQQAEWFMRMKPRLRRSDPIGWRRRCKADRNPAFFKGFANRGNPCRTFIGLVRKSRCNRMIVGVDPPTRKDNRAAGKSHAGRPFDDQKFGRAHYPMAKDHQRRRRDRNRHLVARLGHVVIHCKSPILDPAVRKGAMMGIAQIIGVAGSVSLLAGWRLYLCVFATGLAMRMGWIAVPEHLHSLAVLTSNWVLGAAGIGMVAEFFADKIAWLDSLWDAVHTAIRPIGGALLALALVDASDPKWQIIALLLGGSAALVSHGAKAGTRAVVNASPEPFSNIAVSTGEDVATSGLLFLTLSNPAAAIVVAIILAAAAIAALVMVQRVLKKLFGVPQ